MGSVAAMGRQIMNGRKQERYRKRPIESGRRLRRLRRQKRRQNANERKPH